MMVHSGNQSIWEMDARGLGGQGYPQLYSSRAAWVLISKQKEKKKYWELEFQILNINVTPKSKSELIQ